MFTIYVGLVTQLVTQYHMSPVDCMRPYIVEGSSIWDTACSLGHIRSQHWKRGVVLNNMAVRIVCDKSGKNCWNKLIKVRNFNCPSASHSNIFVCGRGGITPLILNLGTRCWRVVRFTLAPYYFRRKRPRKLGGLYSRSRYSAELRNILPCWESNHETNLRVPICVA
jgi:hypothetical protein